MSMFSDIKSVTPYVVPPVAASAAILPVFSEMMAKTALQQGLPIPKTTVLEGMKVGLKYAPSIGGIVGMQMVFQPYVEKAVPSMLVSSAIIGFISSPLVAVFNGSTMTPKWSAEKSLRNFSVKQCMAITVQETAFVVGITASGPLAKVMKQRCGDNKATEYAAAFIAGATGSLVGHPANTALSRWQGQMTMDSVRQCMWGSARKARAVGVFSVLYKLGKETLGAAEQK